MGKTNKSNFEQDEQLAEEVRKYPCLYNKAEKGYTEKDRKMNAWRAVEGTLGWDEGSAQRKFEVLKKRFSRKRKLLKTVSTSGSGLADVSEAQKDMEEYSFLKWLVPFMRQRKSKSNFEMARTPSTAKGEDADDYVVVVVVVVVDDDDDDGDDDGSDDEVDSELGNTESESTTIIASSSVSKKKGKINLEKRKSEPSKQRGKRIKQSRLIGKDFEVLDSVSRLLKKKLEKSQSPSNVVDSDELFGRMVASELREFPEHLKFQMKHELNNVIYKYRLQFMQNQTKPSR